MNNPWIGDGVMGIDNARDELIDSVTGLAALRGVFNISQSELSALTGVSRTTISRLENRNERDVRSGTIDALLGVFNVLGGEVLCSERDATVIKVGNMGRVHGAALRALKGDEKYKYIKEVAASRLSASADPTEEKMDTTLLQHCTSIINRLKALSN